MTLVRSKNQPSCASVLLRWKTSEPTKRKTQACALQLPRPIASTGCSSLTRHTSVSPEHIPETYRFFPCARFGTDVISGDANFVVDDPDGLYLALISSSMYMTWQKTVGGRIKNDPRFASTVTWNTFPLPHLESDSIAQICRAGAGVLRARELNPDRSLAAQYDPNLMDPGLVAAHDHLDDLVDRAFGAATKGPTERERQQVLFARYEELTAPLFAASSAQRR